MGAITESDTETTFLYTRLADNIPHLVVVGRDILGTLDTLSLMSGTVFLQGNTFIVAITKTKQDTQC